MALELYVQHGSQVYAPTVKDGIAWETERSGSPGKLTFTVIPDDKLKIGEGDPVRFTDGDTPIFYGFIFTLKPKQYEISVTAYDQLRYLKNKDTYVYSNKRADQVVRMIADDFGLQCGTLENTRFVIPNRVEDNQTLFDIIGSALDITLENCKQMYVLYDDFGKIALKNAETMQVPILIDPETAQSYDYSTSIDSETYNKIKLCYENEGAGTRDIYIAQDGSHINEWGVLQYFDTIDENVNGSAKADALLSLYNQKTRNLSVSGAFGDNRVRAGCCVAVKLDLYDTSLQNWMLVEKCKHEYNDNQHTMDLTLRGNGFDA